VAKKVLAVLAGTIATVVMDPLIARFITPDLTFGISASVFVGAVTASLIVKKHGWFYGLVVGIMN